MENAYFQFNSGRISARTKGDNKTLIEGVSFGIRKGETMALIGRTGTGKTMCALEIMDLLPINVFAENSYIMLDGENIGNLSRKARQSKLGTDIVYIPQNGLEFLNPSRTIGRQIFDSLKRLGVKKSDMKRTAMEKLFLAGLDDAESLISKYPFQISGGMAQRVTIALALCSNPKLLIADEPTNGLDENNRSKFVAMLRDQFTDSAKIVITHDPRLEEYCDFTYRIGGKAQ